MLSQLELDLPYQRFLLISRLQNPLVGKNHQKTWEQSFFVKYGKIVVVSHFNEDAVVEWSALKQFFVMLVILCSKNSV